MTDLKPKLRFPEFSEDWEVKKLGEITNKVMYGMNSSAITFDGINKYLRITDIDENTREFTPNPLTSPDGKIEDKYNLKVGDMVLARTGASVGKSYLYKPTDGNLLFAGFLIKFSIVKDNPYFVYSQTLKNSFGRWVQLMSMRSGQPGINAEEFKILDISLPTLPEQVKISNFLKSIDEKIQALKEKKRLLEEYKKGLMQKIFSQELRFKKVDGSDYPDWEEKSFSNFIKLYRGSSPRPINKFITNSDDGINWIKIGDMKSVENYKIEKVSEKITLEGSKHSRKVEIGELILANSMSFGKTYQLNISGCIYDGWFVLREYENHYNKDFLLQLLNSDYLQRQYVTLSTGGVVQNISSDIVYSTYLIKPSISEQFKIAKLLVSIDQKISKLEHQLKKTQTFKKGLLQQMFV